MHFHMIKGRSIRLSNLYSRPKSRTMPQDPRAEAIRKRKATIKLAKWREANEAAPAKAETAKKAVKKPAKKA